MTRGLSSVSAREKNTDRHTNQARTKGDVVAIEATNEMTLGLSVSISTWDSEVEGEKKKIVLV